MGVSCCRRAAIGAEVHQSRGQKTEAARRNVLRLTAAATQKRSVPLGHQLAGGETAELTRVAHIRTRCDGNSGAGAWGEGVCRGGM